MYCKHGLSREKIYSIWSDMKSRCKNPKNRNYKNYGGRGISICEDWNNPCVFFEWAFSHGYKDGLSIDRIDNEKDYSPDNCRWATHKQQARNTRRNRLLTFKGETRCISEWAEITGMSKNVIKSRLNAGWKIENVFTVPISYGNSKYCYGKNAAKRRESGEKAARIGQKGRL